MIGIKFLLLLFIFPFADVKIYIFNTVDSLSTELYDCVFQNGSSYCRRPFEPINLNRSNDTKQCYHDGTLHLFAHIAATNLSISTVLHQWKSSIEKVEQYARYRTNRSEFDGYICECTNPESFGKNCEYFLSNEATSAETLTSTTMLKQNNTRYDLQYNNIVCYMTLECNSGLLCLDWRDICDGLQQCMLGLDEQNCDKLEFNECDHDEYRCMNGMCIPGEYFLDGDFDCLDWSDEIQYYEDKNCPKEVANTQCDDRICPQNQWSCGDGQCIRDRLAFQTLDETKPTCLSRRDQYFLCETKSFAKMWTLPNGQCDDSSISTGLNVTHSTIDEQCQYFLRCVLLDGLAKHCRCEKNFPVLLD